jgi:PBSX family phage portal protein
MTRKRKEVSETDRRARRRQSLLDAYQAAVEKSIAERVKYSRQVDYDDIFDSWESKSNLAGGIRLLDPPYKPGRMYELYEQSSILNACVEAYINNIDGYGYNIVSGRSDDDDEQLENNPIVQELKNFFDNPNDVDSLDTLREKIRRDFEVTGNAYLEVVRGQDNKPTLLFWVNAQRIRISTTREPVISEISVVRSDKLIPISVEKRFRSYCMLSSEGSSIGPRVRWFKEYGDARLMDAETGEFRENIPAENQASEIIHFKHGNGVYGIPRWIATLMSVLGSGKANMVNYDLFDNQGIPPLIVSVAGGALTEESFQDLKELFLKAKGSRNFNRLLILEVEGETTGIDGKETFPRINVQSLAEYRKEDAMFLQYLKSGQNEVQKLGFRLPGMFIGISDDANYATAFIVRTTVEEQVFIPERSRFDEIINKTIVRDITGKKSNLRFKSNGPTMQSTDGLTGLMATLVNSGVFTVNGLISFVNATYGTSIALYDKKEAWANEPIPVAIESKKRSSGESVLPLNMHDDKNVSNETDYEIIEKNEKIYAAVRDIELAVRRFAFHEHAGCA